MSAKASRRSEIERAVKEQVATMDTAIAFLRQHGMVETADRLGGIRDYLAASESFFRRIEARVISAEDRERRRQLKAERIWLDVTGRRK